MQQGGTQYIDSFGLVRSGSDVQGETPIVRFERLVGDLPAQQDNAMVSWSLKGETDTVGRHWLHVGIRACPVLVCQRCMQPFVYQVQAENTLQVMKSEAELDALEAREEDEDEVTERIVGTQRMDVLALVEDELILALPYVPKHEVCPSLPEALADSGSDDARPSPFAVLGKLKKD
ncbi:hypothetical protein ERE07_08930 [Allopusillimonas ginsengisoli]|nr:hypothetical protein ERE07_08930 [Allopusillimonas ginsengisoli]